MRTIDFGKVIPITTGISALTAPALGCVSAPIFLKPRVHVASNTVSFNIPGSGVNLDLASLEAIATITAKATTSGTATANLAIQGTNTISDLQTTLTTAVVATDTTVTLATRTGIASSTFLLLMRADKTGYEWVKNITGAATGRGALTVQRAQFGTSTTTFAIGDYVLYTKSWVTIPTGDATTSTLFTSSTSFSGIATSTPLVLTLDSAGLNMDSIGYPIIRVALYTSATTTTMTGQVSLTGKARNNNNFTT